MIKTKYLNLLAIIISCATLIICGFNIYLMATTPKDNQYSCNTIDITNMYANYIEEWKSQVKKAFNEAELKVFNKTPVPDIIGPNEDATKCICKGTGIIIHGDGHKTQCPFHSRAGKIKAITNTKDSIVHPLN